jgi:hypothetical protein
MCAPDPASYTLVASLLSVLLGLLPAARLDATVAGVLALLRAQSLHPAALARALPDLQTRQARQAFRRVRRLLGRPQLHSLALTPHLLRAGLACIPDADLLLVLDSTRLRRWELFTLGLAWHGRVLPIAWTLLPYPWPKGQFTPTVVALLERTLALWPSDRPLHLVADRGFPSLKLVRCLESWRARLSLDYTLRLRAADWVRAPDGTARRVGDLAQHARAGCWVQWSAAYQQRGRIERLAHLVVGQGAAPVPVHQRGPADRARRTHRAALRQAHVRSKGQRPHCDRAWALYTTVASPQQAVAAYARRFQTEGTYRDLKAWDLEAVAAHEPDQDHLDGLVGLACLGALLQSQLGAAAGRTADPAARAHQACWSTTDRLSLFWRGRQVLHDRAYDWRPWLEATLPALAATLSPPPPDAVVTDLAA